MRTDSLSNIDAETHEWFDDARYAAQQRLERTELTHDEFLTMLLDVWALHQRAAVDETSDTTVATDGGTSAGPLRTDCCGAALDRAAGGLVCGECRQVVGDDVTGGASV